MSKSKSELKVLRHAFLWHWHGISRYGYQGWFKEFTYHFQAESVDFTAVLLILELLKQQPLAGKLPIREAWKLAKTYLPLPQPHIYGTQIVED